ncbi:MAG: hypothetical protein QM715_06000 [Nibricoccus sp.]
MSSRIIPVSTDAIHCEIVSPTASYAAVLAEAAAACANDQELPVLVQTLRIGLRGSKQGPSLTLHLPPSLGEMQHHVWCMACQLIAVCPGARVSVLIRGRNAYLPSTPSLS